MSCVIVSDVDECADSSHLCDFTHNCHNTPGSYWCSCEVGYQLQPYGFSCDRTFFYTCTIDLLIKRMSGDTTGLKYERQAWKKKISDSLDHVSQATPILKYSPGGIYANY